MAKKKIQNYTWLIVAAIVVLAAIVLSSGEGGTLAKFAAAKTASVQPTPVVAKSPSCKWLDGVSIFGKPINSVCPAGYTPVAYEKQTLIDTYDNPQCLPSASGLYIHSSDHKLESFSGGSVPNFGDTLGSVSCQASGTYYRTVNLMYDGVLCCA